ncbi:MAG: sensor domain-containing diguanylate cyclase [Fibromonadaceae bacterium]|nr:sensor domain-containing diguanylate cyclase [Fibromonadaceae bacterium]
MYEERLEKKYRKLANLLANICVVLFCLVAAGTEFMSGHSSSAGIVAVVFGASLLALFLLQRKDSVILPFAVPFLIYLLCIAVSFMTGRFEYTYELYLAILIICATYFNFKSYLALLAITFVSNLVLSFSVLSNFAPGNAWVHFLVVSSAGFLLLMLVRFAFSKENEANEAFVSFDALMKTTPNILVLLDRQNNIRYMSRSASKVFSKDETPEKWTGQNLLELFDNPEAKEQFHKILGSGAFYESHIKVDLGSGLKTYDVAAGKIKESNFDGTFLHINDVSELARLKELAEQESLTDGLTQIPNRRAFDKQIAYEWSHALREQVNLSFLMMDVDFFKKYNDTYGHTQGDVLLRTVSKIFNKSLKRSTDFVARLGGEEFGVLLHATNSHQANITAERIRKAVEDEVVLTSNGEETKVTVSIGVSTLIPQKDLKPNQLVEEADKALYQAKESGRNRVCSTEQE